MVKNTISYKYYIKDHLGNNRMVTDATGNIIGDSLLSYMKRFILCFFVFQLAMLANAQNDEVLYPIQKGTFKIVNIKKQLDCYKIYLNPNDSTKLVEVNNSQPLYSIYAERQESLLPEDNDFEPNISKGDIVKIVSIKDDSLCEGDTLIIGHVYYFEIQSLFEKSYNCVNNLAPWASTECAELGNYIIPKEPEKNIWNIFCKKQLNGNIYKEHIQEDNLIPQNTLLNILDSMVSNNLYAKNLNDEDCLRYDSLSFIISADVVNDNECTNISVYSIENPHRHEESYMGFFVSNGHRYYVKSNVPNSLFSGYKAKAIIQEVCHQDSLIIDPRNLTYIDEDDPGVYFVMDYNNKSGRITNVHDYSISDILYVAEIMPTYKGGMSNLKTYFDKQKAKLKDQYFGRAVVELIIERDGSISHPQVSKNNSNCSDEVILSLLDDMEKWEPAYHRGKARRIRYIVPIVFSKS